MIYRADMSSINYLVTNRNSFNINEMHERTKEGSRYILVDYFDWLTYINRTSDILNIKNVYHFKTLSNSCDELIKLLNSRLNSDKIIQVTDLIQKGRILESNGTKTILNHLCDGYKLFVKEMWDMQMFLMERYEYNNTTIPLLIVPFSFGLNRLSTGHLNIIEERDENGYINTRVEKGVIKDNCIRSKIDFGIRTYTLYKICDKNPYNLPKGWQISAKAEEKASALILNKMNIIAQCYSQYPYTSFVENNPEDEMYHIYKDEFEEKDKLIGSDSFYSNLFLINYPFLLPDMRLAPNIVDGVNTNNVDFIKT